MRLLLDTHALLWFLEGSDLLSAAARSAIEDQTNDRYVSHASAWEVAIKFSLGKLSLQIPYEDLFPRAIAQNGFQMLLPDFNHYRALLDLPWYHRDPFDRLILAQAKTESLTIVTCDPNMSGYNTSLLW